MNEIEPLEADDDGVDLGALGNVDPAIVPALLRLIVPGKDYLHASTWKTAATRLAVIAHAVLPEVRQHSLTDLSVALGCSRALLSLYACRLRDAAGLSCQAGKSDGAREVYAQRARSVWKARKDG